MRTAGILAGRLTALLVLALAGSGATADADCRDCHGFEPRPPGAADYFAYFIEGARHHPVGVGMPAEGAYTTFQRAADGTRFFDSNGDGMIDPDELRLSAGGTVECQSCHREHGPELSAAPHPTAHLRRDNGDSALCRVCHRM